MNKRLDEAVTQIRTLSDDEQSVAAGLLFEFLDQTKRYVFLLRELVDEISRRLTEKQSLLTDDEVEKTFVRLTR